MAEKIDFEPIEFEELSEEISPEYSELESGLIGGAEGLTLGFAGEIGGAAKAIGKTAFGPDELANFLDTYRRERDITEGQIKAAEEANPYSFLAGEVTGSLAPAIASGGASAAASIGKTGLKQLAKQAAKQGLKEQVLTGAKIGAGYGAAQSLGKSEADITKGEIGQAAKDVITGGLAGATIGAAVPGVIGGAKKLGEGLSDAAGTTVREILDAAKRTRGGESVVGTKAATEAYEAFETKVDDFLTSIKNAKKSANEQIAESLNVAEKQQVKFDMTGQIDDAIANFENLAKTGSDKTQKTAKEALEELKRIKSQFQKEVKKEVPYSTKEEALKKAEQKKAGMMLSAEEREAGEMALNRLKNKFAMERAMVPETPPIAAAEVEKIPTIIGKGKDQIEGATTDIAKLKHRAVDPESGELYTTAKRGLAQERIPGDIQVDEAGKFVYFKDNTGKVHKIPYEEGVNPEVAVENLPINLTANQLNDLQRSLEKIGFRAAKTGEQSLASKNVSELSSGMRKQLLEGLPAESKEGFESGMERLSDIHKLKKNLGISKELDVDANKTRIEQNLAKISKYKLGIAEKNLAKKVSEYTGKILGTEEAQTVLNSLDDKVKRLILNDLGTGDAEILAGKIGLVTGGLKGAGIKAGALVGRGQRLFDKMGGLKEYSAKQLNNLADKIEAKLPEKHKDLVGKLRYIAGKSGQTKSALLFTLMQNPESREIIKEVGGIFNPFDDNTDIEPME